MPSLDQIADTLNALLAAELGSPFASAEASMPYAGARDRGQARKVIRYIAEADARRCRDLWSLIASLGMDAEPATARPQSVESYLSLLHVAPQWVASKQRTLQAYRDAVREVGDTTDSIAALLRRHLTEHAGELDVLSGALQH